jgi:hypothetical protein
MSGACKATNGFLGDFQSLVVLYHGSDKLSVPLVASLR